MRAMGRRDIAVAAVVAVVLVACGTRASDTAGGLGPGQTPASSATAAASGSGSSAQPSGTRRPAVPAWASPSATVSVPTVYIKPIDPGSRVIDVMLRGRPDDVVGWAIYRDGVSLAPRQPGKAITAPGMFVGYDGSRGNLPMGGHVFRFDFTTEDGALYASGTVTYPLGPGETMAPEPVVGTRRPSTTPAVEVMPIVPGSQIIEVIVWGTPGDRVRGTVYRDGVFEVLSPELVIGDGGLRYGLHSNESRPIEGHEFRFEFTKDGASYASATVRVPLPPGSTLRPDVAAPRPTGTSTPTPLPTPRPTTGTTSSRIHIDTMTPTNAQISFSTTPNTRVSCTYLADGKPAFFETGLVTVDAQGIGRCGVAAGSGVPALTAVYVIIVFLPDGSELGRATLVYPLP